MKTRRPFTLLEVMIAFFLLTLAAGVIGIRMHKAIQKKKFQSELERLRDRFYVSQRIAVAMQADWKGTLKKEKQGWVFEVRCQEVSVRDLKPLKFSPTAISFNGKSIEKFEIDFFSSGVVQPEGVFTFLRGSEKTQWKTAELFPR